MTSQGAARRDAALAATAAARRASTDTKLLAAIRTLLRQRLPITVSSVARQSGVSRPTIIGRSDIHARILRLAIKPAPTPTRVPLNGDNAVIASLRQQIREQQDQYRAQISELRDQIRHLDRALATAIGNRLANAQLSLPAGVVRS